MNCVGNCALIIFLYAGQTLALTPEMFQGCCCVSAKVCPAYKKIVFANSYTTASFDFNVTKRDTTVQAKS